MATKRANLGVRGPSLIPRLSVPSSNPADGILRITQSLSRCSSVASTPQADLGDIAYMTGSDLLDREVASYLPALRRGSLTTSWATSTLSPLGGVEDDTPLGWNADVDVERGSLLDSISDENSLFGTQPEHFLKNRQPSETSPKDGGLSLFTNSSSLWQNEAFGMQDLLFSKRSSMFNPAEVFFNPVAAE